jgi:hypothetical protein
MIVSGAAFSLLPRWLLPGDQPNQVFTLRPFGSEVGDLQVAFRFGRRPDIVTQILALCSRTDDGEAVECDLILRLPIGLRIEALLALATLSDARAFSWRARCGSAVCGAESEFELTLEQILALGEEHRDQETVTVLIGGEPALLRRPCGLDQRQWLAQSSAPQGEVMLRSMLVRPSLEELLAGGQTLESIAGAVDEVMDGFDPLLGFHVRVVCAQCAAATDVSPDLTEAALDRLFQAQRAMVEEVHRIATHYHWAEHDILALPTWRRHSYLELIAAGAG